MGHWIPDEAIHQNGDVRVHIEGITGEQYLQDSLENSPNLPH